MTFGAAATAQLFVGMGAEAGSTEGTTNIGLTKVMNAVDGMHIEFGGITGGSNIVDETAAVASATSLTAAENAAVAAMASVGVAYFSFTATNTSSRRTTHPKSRSAPMTPLSNWWASPISTTPLTLAAW